MQRQLAYCQLQRNFDFGCSDKLQTCPLATVGAHSSTNPQLSVNNKDSIMGRYGYLAPRQTALLNIGRNLTMTCPGQEFICGDHRRLEYHTETVWNVFLGKQ
jgi:hypothetical protein